MEETRLEHSGRHSHSARQHGAGSRRGALEQNKNLRREQMWQNGKRIIFLVVTLGFIAGIVYLLTVPEEELPFGKRDPAPETERIQQLEREIQRLNEELRQYRNGQLPAAAEE